MTVTVIHPNNGKRPYALNEQGRKVLGSGYYSGRFKPNYPVPAIQGPCVIERFIVEILPADNRDWEYTNCQSWHRYK